MSVAREQAVQTGAAPASGAPASAWMALTLELWLIVALGLATGVTAMMLYGRLADLEQRVETLEAATSASETAAQGFGIPKRM